MPSRGKSRRLTEGRRMTYREHLPQLDGGLFLTDGGIETVLIFHRAWICRCSPPFTC
jgi:hypothetical protein